MHKLAIIVPTRNRPKLLGILLDSLAAQTQPPHQVIVVDGSDEPLEEANPSQWLCGGATVRGREIVNELDYGEWFAEATNCEGLVLNNARIQQPET